MPANLAQALNPQEVGTSASNALIKADPVLGSLLVLALLALGFAVWRWTKALDDKTRVQKEAFEALLKVRDDAHALAQQAIQSAETLSRVGDEIKAEEQRSREKYEKTSQLAVSRYETFERAITTEMSNLRERANIVIALAERGKGGE